MCYALFYISTVYTLGYGVRSLGIARVSLLEIHVRGDRVHGARAADLGGGRRPRRLPLLLVSAVAAAAVGFMMPALLAQGWAGVLVFLSLALGVMGLSFAPLGALLPELFPTEVRYTGAASAYNLGGILGASFAPSLARKFSMRMRRMAASRGSAITSSPPPRSASSPSWACARHVTPPPDPHSPSGVLSDAR